MNIPHFYRDKPLFGLDIGHGNIKVMQIGTRKGVTSVVGYGAAPFPADAIVNGEIADFESIAKAAKHLFDKQIVGSITTRRAAITVPATRTFSRPMLLPHIKDKDIAEAVRLEAEQYIPIALDELYLDYVISNRTAQQIDLMAVAVPKKIIDSYMNFFDVIGIEPVLIETSINAASRSFTHSDSVHDVPTVLIDFGSLSADITVFDKTLIVTGTVPCGGEIFTDLIAQKLHITRKEAHVVKTKYGLSFSKKQKEIAEALQPVLNQLVREVKRMIRYYEERFGPDTKISQIVTLGGGAIMPGLSDHMTAALRLPTRTCNPWQGLSFAGLQPPHRTEQTMYVTTAGLALADPKEVFLP